MPAGGGDVTESWTHLREHDPARGTGLAGASSPMNTASGYRIAYPGALLSTAGYGFMMRWRHRSMQLPSSSPRQPPGDAWESSSARNRQHRRRQLVPRPPLPGRLKGLFGHRRSADGARGDAPLSSTLADRPSQATSRDALRRPGADELLGESPQIQLHGRRASTGARSGLTGDQFSRTGRACTYSTNRTSEPERWWRRIDMTLARVARPGRAAR